MLMQRTRPTPAAIAASATSYRCSRLQRDTHAEAVLPRGSGDRAQILNRLVVEGDAVRAGLAKRTKVPFRRLDHQVDVDPAAAVVNQASNRPKHDWADDDRLDEMPVAHVVMENARAGGEELLDLLAKLCEVGRVEGGLDLGLSQPVPPGHLDLILRGERARAPRPSPPRSRPQPRDEEAARFVQVR